MPHSRLNPEAGKQKELSASLSSRGEQGAGAAGSTMNHFLVQRHMRQLSAMLAALSLVGLAAAQVQFPELPKGADTNEFTMRVKVVDAVSGRPLPNSAVQIPNLMPMPERPVFHEWQFFTDDQGVTTLRMIGAAVAFNYFALSVSNAGYPSRSVAWQAPQVSQAQPGSIRGALPAEYTFRLERGVTIGGVVKDERGQPVAGITVVPWGTGAGAFNYGNDRREREYSALNRDDTKGAVTDARGLWRFADFPTDIARATLDLVRPDGSRMMFITPNPDPRFPTEPGEPVEMAALRATNAVMVLKEGVAIRGVVVDESGKPVAGAVVRERAGNTWNMPIFATTNDARGRFEFPHRTGVQYIITAEAEGYALNSVVVTATPDLPETKVVLPAARPLRLRVVGEKEEPVVGAVVSAPEYRNRGHLVTWKGTTDAEGRVTWNAAPLQPLSLAIASSNYLIRMKRLESREGEQIIRVRKDPLNSVTVQLSAVDAETKQPLQAFSVWKEIQPIGGSTDVGWRTSNGLFKGQILRSEFRQEWSAEYKLQVRAEGYQPWSSASLSFEEGDFTGAATLKRAKAPVGTVLLPDGQPADEARVTILPPTETIYLYSANNFYDDASIRNGMTRVKTGKDGRFSFDAVGEDHRLVVIHRSGFAALTAEQLRDSSSVKLDPYATVQGVVIAGGKPLAKERLSLRAPVSWEGNDGFQVSLSSMTDSEGRFLFTNVPAGSYLLHRQPVLIMGHTVAESHRQLIEVKAGEMKEINYTFGGRTVVGRVESDSEVDWKNDHHLLMVKLPPPPPGPNFYAYADQDEFQKARRAHGKSKAVLDYERRRQQFELVFDKDGNFKIDDVPPGKYELNISVTKPMKGATRNRWERSQEIVGSIKREVTIPAGPVDQEFDLGTFEMEVKDSPGVKAPPMDLVADQLDGKPFNLISLRGRPVVVCFWGKWAPGSEKNLADLRAAVATMGDSPKLALVTVNLDSRIEDARDGVKDLGTGWIHARLSGAAMFTVTERWKVDALPTVVLLDAEGRVKGRDIDSKRLASSVKRLMAAKN